MGADFSMEMMIIIQKFKMITGIEKEGMQHLNL